MKNKWFTYIKINEEDKKIRTAGIEFKEFMKGIKGKPNNILILDGYPLNSERHYDLSLDYIKNSDLEEFYEEDVYGFGDFGWIDFENEECLDNIDKLDLSKLLYLRHRWEPIDNFLFDCLKNKYAYFAHDDDYITQVYMKNIKEYKEVINYKILKELKGRKKYIADIQDEILEKIYDLCKKGIVIDFEESYYSGVRIYTIGDVASSDYVHDELDRCRKKINFRITLDYDIRKKNWSIYE